MAYVIELPNAFDPTTAVKHVARPGVTIRGWLEEQYPGFKEFTQPTICVVNGKPVLRKDWNRFILQGDVVVFSTAVGYGPFIVIAVVLIAIALTFVFVAGVTPPITPGEAPASDPVFSTKGQQNAIRLGEPIEVCYGRNRIYPSYASRPYFQYIDNDQFQHSLFCLGQGEYEIHAIQIGDTDINSYQEVQYEVIPPGGSVTLFPTNVITSTEAGGQTLFAPNEPEYVAPGYVGPFPSNPPSTQVYKIEIDVIFPKGLYAQNSDGNLASMTINFDVEWREIDDLGAPVGLGLWTVLHENFTAKTTTPQRKTFSYDVLPARYEVRLRRTDTKNLSYRAGHEIVWDALRGIIEATPPDFGNVTLLAVVVRATNNLNERTQQEFNVLATRKLRVLQSDGTLGTDLVATRGIVPAFLDAAMSVYGGRIFDDSFFDWGDLAVLDSFFEHGLMYFDWIFRDPITVWEAMQTIARAGRSVPILIGSLITLRRDEFTEIPVAMFTPDNILSGTLEWNVRLWDLDEYDSIRVEYTEPDTGYKQQQVLAILPGGTGNNPKDIRFPGIQDRTRAYHEGLFMLAGDKYQRENAVFDTGLEGYIPRYGDLVAIAHDVPRWGQYGWVVHAEATGDSDASYRVWVSEPLRFDETGTYQIQFRGRHGEIIGPFTALETSDPQQVVVTIGQLDFDFLLGGDNEPMLFQFGPVGRITKLCKVAKIEPQGGEAITLTVVNDAPIIYSFDGLVPPALNSPSIPPRAPDLPVVRFIFIRQTDPAFQIANISWTAAFGAQYYVVQTSIDGVNWTEKVTTVRTSLQVQVSAGPFWARVAGVNSGQGPWKTGHTTISPILGLDILIPWDFLEWKLGWVPVIGVSGYQVKIYTNDTAHNLLATHIVLDPYYDHNYEDALLDGTDGIRDIDVEVDELFGDTPAGAPASQTLHNTIPLPATGLTVTYLSTESGGVLFRLSWTVPHEDDVHRIKVWVSDNPGFDPSITVPTLDDTFTTPGWAGIPDHVNVLIPFDSSGGTWDHYWRVGLFDVWGDEISTNVTAQQTIPHHP